MTSLLAVLLALSPAEKTAAARVTANEISAHVRFLADDLLEGRKPGTTGSNLAMLYLATQLEAFGYQPGGDNGTYLQSVPMVELHAEEPKDVTFIAGGQPVTLHTGGGTAADLILEPNAHIDRATLNNTPLVFVGYGITAPEYGWDDYANVDVKGKIVVVMNFNPPFKGEGVRLWYGRWDYKYINASKHGAAGALVIHTTPSAGYPWQVLANSNTGTHQDLPPNDAEPHTMQFQGWITDDAATKVVKQSGQDIEALRTAANKKGFTPVTLNASLTLDMPIVRKNFVSANVVGILPGTDPKLKDEVVLYTAHHDHLGRVTPIPPATDGIFNGALDNASGCAAVLTIAHAMTFAPPKRSVAIAFVTAEEQGLLGSKYLAQHPPVPAGRIAVDINLDSINKWGTTTDLGLSGMGKSTVDAVVKAVAKEQNRSVHGEAHPDRGMYYRSDQFSMARVGVPSLYMRGGPDYLGKPQGWGDEQQLLYEKQNYHQPSDEYHGDWNLDGAVQDAQLELISGMRIGNAPQMPTWVPGDEFEAARKSAQHAGTH
jgi:Zn-dependent M28 family amino/carboxypeptidase